MQATNEAWLLEVKGAAPGRKIALAPAGEFLIGRAPGSALTVQDDACGWRHCLIKQDGGRYLLQDFKSPGGTFLNGRHVSQSVLTNGDQLSIGASRFIFCDGEAGGEQAKPGGDALLKACTVQTLVRSMAMASDPHVARMLEAQVIALIGELLPCDGGFLLMGGRVSDLQAQLRERREWRQEGEALCLTLERMDQEGEAVTPLGRWQVLPLYVRGGLAGVLGLRMTAEPGTEGWSEIALMTALALENAHEVETLQTQNALLVERLGNANGMIGRSVQMERVLKVIDRVGPQDVTVLVLGETGTGKELAARALHAASPRRQAPFVAINCAALPDHLVESELFGHEKGAFTGAASQKKGKLEMATGGTVLLDEIGELPLAMQAKLLRVLQQREFERVGGTRTLPLDIRLVAATNRDLQEETKHGRFREDLFHRLNVVTVRLPALRERVQDIPELAAHFLAASAGRFGRKGLRLSDSAVQCLSRYHWPGNVRELENAMERAAVMCESGEVTPEDLPETVGESALTAGIAGAYQKNVGEAKREAIVRAWGQAGGDYKGAAKLLGIHPNSLLRLVRNLGMRELLG